MTTEDALARFEREYLEYNNVTKRRREEQVVVLRDCAAFMGKPLTEIEPSDLQQFLASLNGGNHVNTVRKKLHMVRSFIGWAWRAGEIDAERYLRLKEIKPPRGSTERQKPQPYTRTEIERYWSLLDERFPVLPTKGRGCQAFSRWLQGKGPWKVVIERHCVRFQLTAATRLALDLGLRRGEIFRLTLNDLHYDNEYLVVRGKADANTGHVRERAVPFTEATREAVFDWIELRSILRPSHDSPWLTLTTRAGAVAIEPLSWDRFQRMTGQVGPGPWRWHRFRHTAATNWLRAGVTLEDVSRLLGHASLQQTLGYAEILKSDLASRMGKAEERFAELVGPARAA